MSQISVRSLHKSFGKTPVIHDMNLDVQAGEFMVLLGPSGCGKSTLLRLIAGLEAASQGDILIEGKVVNELEPRERGCAMVFQNYALYPHMTVSENIGYALKVSGLPKAERLLRIREVAKSLGLTDYLDRKPAQLSGGQRQRVAMGRAMIREPRIFLYDEPLSNLDAKLRVSMRVEIRKLHQRLGATSLFVTHDQVEAMTLADRIAVLNKGVIEQIGRPAEIYSRPASTYVASFVGSPGMNLLSGTIDAQQAVFVLEDGQRLPYAQDRWPRLPSGPAICGFRAENSEIRSRGRRILANWQFVEELGASRLIHAKVGMETIVVANDDIIPDRPEATIGISVDPQSLHFFDQRSGLRMPFEKTSDPVRARQPSELLSA